MTESVSHDQADVDERHTPLTVDAETISYP
jgi:hypothetical protein